MANDAGVKNITELANFGQNVKKLGDNICFLLCNRHKEE